MSQKIAAKNLQYNSSLPPFLARLRGQEAESRAHGGPDPMLAGHRRIGKPRSASAEAEDAPLVVDERGEVVNLGDLNKSEEEGENGEKVTEAGESKKEEVAGGQDITKSKKKRKLGKVIGGRDEDEDEEGNDEKRKDQKTEKRTDKEDKPAKTEGSKGDGKKDAGSGNKKKKAKKIKLSFGDEEEG